MLQVIHGDIGILGEISQVSFLVVRILHFLLDLVHPGVDLLGHILSLFIYLFDLSFKNIKNLDTLAVFKHSPVEFADLLLIEYFVFAYLLELVLILDASLLVRLEETHDHLSHLGLESVVRYCC